MFVDLFVPNELPLLPAPPLGESVLVVPESPWEDDSHEEELLRELESLLPKCGVLNEGEAINEAVDPLTDLMVDCGWPLKEDLATDLLLSLDGVRGTVNLEIDPYRLPISAIDDRGLNRLKFEGGGDDIERTDAGLTG